jgi:hypothetical protein
MSSIGDWIADQNEEAMMADGFDAAILGIAMRCGKPGLVVYDAEKCIQILMDRDGMSYEDAYDFFQFNVVGSWVGEGTPLYLWRYEEGE